MRLSVVTICLNPGRYLAEAIDSVLRQTHGDFEYWLIDGGSTDGSLDIIRQYAADDPRVRWSSAGDAGIADAMNRGVRSCRGDIVAFLHADDRYPDPSVLDDVDERFLRAPHVLWLTGGIREIDGGGRQIRTLPVRDFKYRRLLRNNILYHPATFVRREAFEQVGLFDTGLHYAMDYDFWLRLGKLSPPLVVEKTLAEFRVHKGSLSTAQRLATVEEEYLVRCRYVHGWLGRLGHSLYHAWRRRGC